MTNSDTAYQVIIDKLLDLRLIARESGDRAAARCPAHDDRNPSLSVGRRRDGNGAVVHCQAGCDTRDVMAALDLTMADLFDEPKVRSIYQPRRDYHYPGGRVVHRKPNKNFPQSGDKADRSLYGSDKIIDTTTTVYIAEGEKDCEAIEAAGAVAVCSAMGAGKAHLADWSVLAGKQVIIVADKDEAGRAHAHNILVLLDGIAASGSIVETKVGKDFADHFAAGYGLAELVDVDEQVRQRNLQEVDVDDTDVPHRRARITWADQIEPEPVTWAWEEGGEGRIPAGSLSIAAAREGTGKSSFGIWKTAHITRGTLPGSYYGIPRKVFYVAMEDSWKHTLVPRLIAAGADLTKIGRFEVVSVDDEELTLSLPHDNSILESEIRHHDVALVVIDPLMSVIGERIDTHREREVRSALDPLAKIADRTGSVILGIAHFNKGSGTDTASLITGSGAFKNVPRSIFGFARDDSDENGGRVMTQVKNSLGRDDLPSLSYVIETAEITTKKGIATTGKFVFTGESDRSVADVLRDSRGGPEEQDERKEAAAWLVDYLTDNSGEMPANDVFKAGAAAGYTRDVLKRSKGKQVRSVKSRSAWVWQIIVPTPDQQGSTKGAREQGTETRSLAPLPAPLTRSTERPALCPTCHRAPARSDTGQCDMCTAKTNANLGGTAA